MLVTMFPFYCTKSKAASLFGTGPCFGWSSQEVLGWCHYGGGMELLTSYSTHRTKHRFIFQLSDASSANGLFKEEIKDASQMDGLKYRTVGLA